MALVNPHGGGALKPLLLQGEALKSEMARAQTLPKIKVSSREKGDIIMLGIGGFTPLDGFMSRADWEGVCDGMRTSSGLFWPIPITLSAGKAFADALRVGQDIALVDPDDDGLLATMTVTERYAIDKAHECATVFRTTDLAHPGVKLVMEQGDVNLAGPVRVLSTGGCCNCCPSNPTAIPVEEHKRQELHCASVNCACPKNIECPAAASVLDFVARCVEGTCKAVPKG